MLCLCTQVVVPPSSNVPMVSVSPPPSDVMDFVNVLMGVMRPIAVGCPIAVHIYI